MYGRKPDLDKLHPFGCLAFIHISKKDRNGALNTATHHGALMCYATGSDGRIIGYRIYNYDTNRFVYPSDVRFNDDVPAIPYIASLRLLAPAVRLVNRSVMKTFNGTPYYGKVTHTRLDTDGELLYCVTYSDNDYEEYNLHEIMRYLQPYDPADDIDDTLEITPFFGSTRQNHAATDTKQKPLTTNQPSGNQPTCSKSPNQTNPKRVKPEHGKPPASSARPPNRQSCTQTRRETVITCARSATPT